MHEPICRFVVTPKAPDVIHIIHFVYETSMGGCTHNRLETAYKLGLVASGSAEVICQGKKESLQPGDLFFSFPAVPYTMETSEDFTYLYVSFMGLRANMLLDRLKINGNHFVFRGFSSLLPLWVDAVQSAQVMPELAAESVLLFTLMKLANTICLEEEVKVNQTARNMLLIKKKIDEEFATSELTVAALAAENGYHEKYISTCFKKYFKMGIQEYITQLRINRACVLMEQGYTSVKDISALCGYSDAMYFSKVFRSKMGMPPRAYIQSRVKEKSAAQP